MRQTQETCQKRGVKWSDTLFHPPTTTINSISKHNAGNNQTSHPFPSPCSPPQPSRQPGCRPSLLSHRHKADTNVTLWKIITNKRTADCKQLAPLSGLSLVISLNPGREQDHWKEEGGVVRESCAEGGKERRETWLLRAMQYNPLSGCNTFKTEAHSYGLIFLTLPLVIYFFFFY